MIKGSIDPQIGVKERVLVVDADLLYLRMERKRTWFPWLKELKVTFTPMTKKLVAFMRSDEDMFDRVIIAVVGKWQDAQYAVQTLQLQYTVVEFYDEDSYKVWLEIQNPVVHLAQLWRRYYCKTSLWCEESFLDKRLEK